jgi:hypothetical protein
MGTSTSSTHGNVLLRGLPLTLLGLGLSCSSFASAQQSPPRVALSIAQVNDTALPDAPGPAGSTSVEEPTPPHTLLWQAQQGTSSSGTQQKPTTPSLEDLGLSADQMKPDLDLQARLDRRTRMLKMHQRLGILTLAPLAAACITSAAAPPDPRNGGGNTVGRDIHLSLGALSVASYGATAYYAIRAPRIDSGASRGAIKWHRYLIYIHGPGMILTPILGAMAFNQANNGEKVHGIASAHAAVAWTTVVAYGTAIVAVSWPLTHKH